MTLVSQIAWDDTVLPFQLDAADMRGRFVRLSETMDQMLGQHEYPRLVEAILAEAGVLTALIGQAIKLRWKLSLQIRGDGPIKLVATDYFGPKSQGDPANIRAYASFDKDALDDTKPAFEQLGQGYFAILIDQGPGTEPYQGITPLDGGSLSACAESYFAQSEQLPTRFAMAFGRSAQPDMPESWRAGGMMIQHLPKGGASQSEPPEMGEQNTLSKAGDFLDDEAEDHWNRINLLLDTAEETELVGPLVSPPDLLVRLFHQEVPRVYDTQKIQFGCTCSAQKVMDSLAAYGGDDIEDLVTESGVITADCQFCGKHYEFSPDSITKR